MENKKELIKRGLVWVASLAAVGLVVMTIPIVKKHFEIENLKKEIEKTQLEIELNKEEWNKCQTIMDEAHKNNEALREKKMTLMVQYNELVGFMMASE